MMRLIFIFAIAGKTVRPMLSRACIGFGTTSGIQPHAFNWVGISDSIF